MDLQCGLGAVSEPSSLPQAKAQQTRDRLVEEQRLRSKVEQEKVREARETRESRVRAWREGMEERLLRAEQLREGHLQEKRRKAQDEDAKVCPPLCTVCIYIQYNHECLYVCCVWWQVSEIAFINSLEAQNRKIQVLRRHQVSPPCLLPGVCPPSGRCWKPLPAWRCRAMRRGWLTWRKSVCGEERRRLPGRRLRRSDAAPWRRRGGPS